MKKIVRFAYRRVITYKSEWLWDKYVHQDSFEEYLLQHQKFNVAGEIQNTFRKLLHVNSKAEQLHFLTGNAISGYIDQLNKKIIQVPDVLGNHYLEFDGYHLDIVNTDITDIEKHKIGITFYSVPYLLLDVINDCYLVSKQVKQENKHETLMFSLESKISICYYENM